VAERFLFFGVSTHGSSIMRVFPLWAEALGLDAEIAGRDIPIGASAADYRDAVQAVRADRSVRGGLVTSHKVAFFEHAADLFDELDDEARRCGEISCLAKRGPTLRGVAKDPIIAARVLGELLPDDHWRRAGGHALILGAGGAGTALSVALLGAGSPPARVVVTDTDPGQLRRLAEVHRRLAAAVPVDYRLVGSAGDSDSLVAGLPPGSLVVNATGVGKDFPGSPLSDDAVFPVDGVAWELNYRGDLAFLGQARRQSAARRLRVENGWAYFVQAWVEVIEEVFERPISPAEVVHLAELADGQRPGVQPAPAEEAGR